MTDMYFDVEVAYLRDEDVSKLRQGLRGPQPTPVTCKIITFQYQFLDKEGRPKGGLQVFREWESSEEAVIRRAFSLINPDTKWDIIPVGQNILFDLGMLRGRAAGYGIRYDEWFLYNDLPKIDIKAILMGMNGFAFKDSGLDKFTGKESSGIGVPLWYANREYDRILDYVRKEATEFTGFYERLKKALPEFRRQHGFEKLPPD